MLRGLLLLYFLDLSFTFSAMELSQCEGWRLARLLIEGRAALAVPQVPPRRVRVGEMIGLMSVMAVHFVGNLAF